MLGRVGAVGYNNQYENNHQRWLQGIDILRPDHGVINDPGLRKSAVLELSASVLCRCPYTNKYPHQLSFTPNNPTSAVLMP